MKRPVPNDAMGRLAREVVRQRATRRADLRARLTAIEEQIARMEAAQAVNQWQRTQYTNGRQEESEEGQRYINAPERSSPRQETGGRRVNATWHGTPIYEDEEQ